jgi:hypothetical protein
MATGDQNDMAARIRSYLPQGWFPSAGLPITPATSAVEPAPVLNAILQGFASALAFCYSLITYTRLQTRIATATDGFLDLIANDFFGTMIMRGLGQSDSLFRRVILGNLFIQLVTRVGITGVLVELTGRTPTIFEPSRPMDAFCLGIPQNGGLGYSQLGDYLMPAQALIIAHLPLTQGIPYVAGLGSTYGGLTQSPYMNLPAPNSGGNFVTAANIYAAVEASRAVGVTTWVNIS